MQRQYLHLIAYRCDKCQGPVVAASVGTRETERSMETRLKDIGALCLACGAPQSTAIEPVRYFQPAEWAY